jgi:hypothetical protein
LPSEPTRQDQGVLSKAVEGLRVEHVEAEASQGDGEEELVQELEEYQILPDDTVGLGRGRFAGLQAGFQHAQFVDPPKGQYQI